MPTSSDPCITDQLYREHGSWLRVWLRARTGCCHQAADLAQDTFVRVLARREELRRVPMRQPRAFLRVIANGLLIDHFRRRAVEQAFWEALAAQPEWSVASLEEREILLETLQRIDAVLDRLPAPVRRAFLLSQLDGCSYAKIAVQMGVSLRTVKRYMQQGFTHCLATLL